MRPCSFYLPAALFLSVTLPTCPCQESAPIRGLWHLRHFLWLLRYLSPALAGCDCQEALQYEHYNIAIPIIHQV